MLLVGRMSTKAGRAGPSTQVIDLPLGLVATFGLDIRLSVSHCSAISSELTFVKGLTRVSPRDRPLGRRSFERREEGVSESGVRRSSGQAVRMQYD